MNSLAVRACECDLAATNHATVAGYTGCPGAGKATPATGRASGLSREVAWLGGRTLPALPLPPRTALPQTGWGHLTSNCLLDCFSTGSRGLLQTRQCSYCLEALELSESLVWSKFSSRVSFVNIVILGVRSHEGCVECSRTV